MTSPDPTLLLPYRLEHTPATATPQGVPALHRVRLTIGDHSDGRADWPVRCTRIALGLPAAHSTSLRAGEPVILRTRLERERGPGRGRQWLVKTTTTDPTVTTLTLTPAEPARFDGTWTLTLTLDISTPLGTRTRITEETATGGSSPRRRAGSATLTSAPLPN
ncbi:hypothetical protein SLV14_006375 [Streptomyces sp. Je 1-4]|uniref:hypothetical protein n=1 Tax=Streptomyces TaxID=1883 RepID=UPI0021D8A83A|nr:MULTISPECIES: hypothetical protein [unclassified Streptomyces]UYB43406.1 hypothetical protein SLV14_006375 [Streptomyces sp. Je 1-4]UZQ39785.1 hypothetical protein SLV14N_006375 [Streptomyces sp. Je 1-4] [Streptomyces sp. Je 1-4 4N24]UZQ47202.1 hypothetical protein SLV14NA_006375 [Streptomyces sp. Je 1-4] [Streptomyces sp. Je 1-4 4N24_ara]